MAGKARRRPSWKRNRSGLPTPPGYKFMTIEQRLNSAQEGGLLSRAGDVATSALKRVAKTVKHTSKAVTQAVTG